MNFLAERSDFPKLCCRKDARLDRLHRTPNSDRGHRCPNLARWFYICCFTGCHSLLRFEGLDRDQRHCWKVEVERNGLEGSNVAKCRRFIATAKSAHRGIDGIIIRWSCLYAMGAEPRPETMSRCLSCHPEGPERTALEHAGLKISPNVNRHDGQGTASVTAEFLNAYIELLWPVRRSRSHMAPNVASRSSNSE
jgi:hypothetical protein